MRRGDPSSVPVRWLGFATTERPTLHFNSGGSLSGPARQLRTDLFGQNPQERISW